MGRVNRYKKTKHLDPHNLDPGRLLHLDQPPSSSGRDEQPVPRAAQSIIRQAKRTKDLQALKRKQRLEQLERPSKKARVKARSKPAGQSSNSPSLERRAGESDKDYLRRLDIDAASLALRAAKKTSKTFEKRRRYLQEKERRRGQSGEGYIEPKWTDEVKFGEVVQAPPSLTTKPRKAAAVSHTPKLRSLLLSKQLAEGESACPGSGPAKQQSEASELSVPKARRLRDMSRGQRRQIEEAREEAISLYRQIKQQRLEKKT